MHSKKDVCFTIVLTLAASWYLGAHRVATPTGIGDSVPMLADGTHPPPWPPSQQGAAVLQADGTHPPPVPWLSAASQVS
jgi:hypothetical protein